MTLKTILKNFLNYADTLEAQKKLGKDIYEADFQKLKGLTEELKHDKDYSTSEGLKEVNRRKNRYKDILPYDYTRVILSEYPGVPGSDYINANYIKGASGSLAYIASQGPLPNTVVDFWRMIWECEVQVIVMACNEQESGKYKCECYWPTDEEKKQYGNINIEFVKWRQVCPDFLVRTLKACWENEERVICQFHYTTWPDHGVPNSVQPILELVRLIRDCQASEAVPVLIHCSAGCGRTGTICAIDYVWGLMRMGKLTKNFNLYNVIADMRRQRIAMVQTKEQYVLVHKAVSSLFEQQLRVIDSHTYENLDEDGEPLILKELHQQEEDIYEDILDPPLLDESLTSNEKLADRKPSNTFHEYAAGNKDAPPIPSKRDPFSENLLNFSKNLYYKLDNETLEKNETHSLNNPEEKSEQSFKNREGEYEIPNSRNSQILMKLCREESVKRLISGWNKAAEYSDDIKNISRDIHFENNFHSKTPLKKLSDHILNEQKKSLSANDKSDVFFASKAESCVINPMDKFQDVSDHQNLADSFSKNSPPDDIHAGKLVGKATVIRRPSIAKLKALFEKTSQNNADCSETGRRRALFRSHSHYVSYTSRAFSLSESTNQSNNCNLEPTSPLALKSDEHKSEKENTNIQNNIESFSHHNLENLGNSHIVCSTQQVTVQDNTDYDNPSNSNRKAVSKSSHASSADNSRESTVQTSSLENPTNHSSVYESHFHAYDLNDNAKVKIKQTPSNSSKKDKPPELPVKRKQVAPLPQTSVYVEKHKETENIVPRFKVNVSKENILDPSNKISNMHKDTVHKSSSQTEKPFKEICSVKASVASPDWNSDDSLREYVRRSQDVQKHVLHKNQSFSDPEQSARYVDQSIKQVAKPKLSLTDQTYPKLTYSAEKGLDEKLSFSHECAYMNVNSLAQKNIRQIEEKLKNHPRGAIIDLTSRKSYIDGMTSTPDRQYIFKNTSEPVKFLQRQEARELLPQDKINSKNEQLAKDSTSKIQSSNTKTVTSKSENTRMELDHLNSKNLLLHSPPPKTKRGHLSKPNSKGPSVTPNLPDSNEVSSDSKKLSSNTSDKTSKVINSPNYISANISQNVNTTLNNPSPAADRSDPRYFPVMRQTASDAKYESEKHKAEAREAASGRQINAYEPLYSSKPVNSVYHKYPVSYDKTAQEAQVVKDFKYPPDSAKSHFDKEPLYGLQRSTSGPQILPSSDSNQKIPHSSDLNGSYNIYGQIGQDNKLSKSFHGAETRAIPQYDTNQAYAIYGSTGQHMFPPGPPKPPRTFHYDMKSNQEKPPDTYSKTDHNAKREGGRYIVSVASPKHSSVQNPMQATNMDYKYERIPDVEHVTSKNVYQPQPTYVSPVSNEVHMSKSYPLTNYDRSYYPRPYGKQYYPESVAFRNVHPVHHVSNNIYAVPEKPPYPQKNIYGTVRHKNTFSDYENIHDAQMDYMRTMGNSGTKNEHQNIYQSLNPNSVAGLQYSQSDANVYGVLQASKTHAQFGKSHTPPDRDFKNVNENSVPKRVYFDTLQRKNKQHVTWEQRRSHDDMDIRPAPSARLREQIHARRSMVELDNLEISVVSDEGYPEKSIVDTLTSPTSSYSKVSAVKRDRLSDLSQNKNREENNETSKEYLRRNSVPMKEPVSFGETISKAFGKLTSFTKFNVKEAQSSSSVPIENSNTGSKVNKQKEKEKHNFTLQSPSSSKESPSEQWTQV